MNLPTMSEVKASDAALALEITVVIAVAESPINQVYLTLVLELYVTVVVRVSPSFGVVEDKATLATALADAGT